MRKSVVVKTPGTSEKKWPGVAAVWSGDNPLQLASHVAYVKAPLLPGHLKADMPLGSSSTLQGAKKQNNNSGPS